MKTIEPMPGTQSPPGMDGSTNALAAELLSVLPASRERGLGELTDIRRSEALLHVFAHRLMMAQEVERSRLSLELHDHITQLVCAIILRCQKLAGHLTGNEKAHAEAVQLGDLMGQAASEVERISRHLRPGVLETLGLVAAMRSTIREFTERTGLTVTPNLPPLAVTLSPEADLALFRILQESLKNIEQHARAQFITVRLVQERKAVLLTIQDDGIGFDPARFDAPPPSSKGWAGLGLLGMRERACCVGGVLQVESAPDSGTLVRAQIPFTSTGTLPIYAPPHYSTPR